MPGEFHEQTAWWATVDKVTKVSDTAERLTLFLDHQCLSVCCVAGTVWVLGICQGKKQRKIPAFMELQALQGFPGGSDGKESACNAGDLGLIPGLGRSPGEGNGFSIMAW